MEMINRGRLNWDAAKGSSLVQYFKIRHTMESHIKVVANKWVKELSPDHEVVDVENVILTNVLMTPAFGGGTTGKGGTAKVRVRVAPLNYSWNNEIIEVLFEAFLSPEKFGKELALEKAAHASA